MGEKNNGILEKTSPNSPFIIHHSSFIISSISTSPKFLRSPFFQPAKLLRLRDLQNLTLLAFVHEPVQTGCDLMGVCGGSVHEILFGTRILQVPRFFWNLDTFRKGLGNFSKKGGTREWHLDRP